jgi:hypothetical protein
MAEQTGCLILLNLWSYVTEMSLFEYISWQKLLFNALGPVYSPKNRQIFVYLSYSKRRAGKGRKLLIYTLYSFEFVVLLYSRSTLV